MNTVIINNLSIGYRAKVIGSNLNGKLQSGQLTCLLGTNGVGKSTLLRTMAGLQPALRGGVVYQNDAAETKAVSELSKGEVARLVAVVLTELPDVRQLSVSEVVGMGRLPYTGFFGMLSHDDRQIVNSSLAQVGIRAFAQRQFDALSDGERQKVMIAKALAQQTPVILLDEPTAFLDYPSKVEVMKALRHMANDMNKTILLSTHDLNLALHYADRLLMLKQGLHEITKEELRAYLQNLTSRKPDSNSRLEG
jgi:iron complex transport system ATP-binding protein